MVRVYLWARGRFDESVSHARRAQELDPLSLADNLTLGVAHYFAGDFEQSAEQLRKTLEIEPRFYPARVSLSFAYAELGQFDQAIAEAESARATEDLPLVLAAVGSAYAVAERRADALRVVDELKERSKTSYVSAFEIATVYSDVGEQQLAIEWFHKALDERASWMVFLKTSPKFKLLHSTPGYSELLSHLKLV